MVSLDPPTPDPERPLSPERYAAMVRKAKARKVSLRQLNKHIQFMQYSLSAAYRQNQELQKENAAMRKMMANGVTCQVCNFREWYRWRNGETYPGRPGWRFLRWLPPWR